MEEIPDSVDGVGRAPWETAALALAPANFVELLTRRSNDGILTPGLFASSAFTFWHTVLRFAGALVARQCVLPGIEEENGRPAARWQPVLLGRDAQAVARLAHAMPDAARAVGEATVLPPDPTATVVGEMIGLLVDALMRSDATAARTAVLTTLDDRWLAALRKPNAELRGDAAAIDALRQRLEDWRRPIAVAASSPSRLCFRIEEAAIPLDSQDPGPIHVPDAPWRIRYLLQAHADPSLLLPVREAWNGSDRTLSRLVGSQANVLEFLHLSFAQAGRISPAVGAGRTGAGIALVGRLSRPEPLRVPCRTVPLFLSEAHLVPPPELDGRAFGQVRYRCGDGCREVF